MQTKKKRKYPEPPHLSDWRLRLHDIIFEADTPLGKLFDVTLLWFIGFSVLAVMLESVASINAEFGVYLRVAEWFFTIYFTIEYLLRILIVWRPLSYIFSFYGIVDLLAILPTYLSLFFFDTHYLLMIRALRLLRVFRVFKLGRYVSEAQVLRDALTASRPKITVFLGSVLTLVLVMGALMYLIEGEENGFTSIPRSIYWAIVTMTTVGYGDIAPRTPLGQGLAAILMILGYGIIAIPTGIVSAELARKPGEAKVSTHCCLECSREGHDTDAGFCKYCGAKF